MRTRETTFLAMDAGEQREFLAEQLADWIAAEFISHGQAQVFYRRARILARTVGMPFVEVMDELRADAEAILADRAGLRGKVSRFGCPGPPLVRVKLVHPRRLEDGGDRMERPPVRVRKNVAGKTGSLVRVKLVHPREGVAGATPGGAAPGLGMGLPGWIDWGREAPAVVRPPTSRDARRRNGIADHFLAHRARPPPAELPIP